VGVFFAEKIGNLFKNISPVGASILRSLS
jgi:hypothetical protein